MSITDNSDDEERKDAVRELRPLIDKLQVATVALLLFWAVIAFQPILTGYHKVGTTSPIPNTTMDKDGVIRLNPQNGCGPNAHVEDHPPYGALCVVNDSEWRKFDDTASKPTTPPCIGGDDKDVLLSCQQRLAWTKKKLQPSIVKESGGRCDYSVSSVARGAHFRRRACGRLRMATVA